MQAFTVIVNNRSCFFVRMLDKIEDAYIYRHALVYYYSVMILIFETFSQLSVTLLLSRDIDNTVA